MQTVTVTIGRNVGDAPLPQDAWLQFRTSVRQAVDNATDEVWVAGAPYRGSWDGVSEDAAVYYGPVLSTAPEAALAALRATLANLASYYGQDAIGLSVGESTLVESFTDAPAAEAVS